MTRLKPNEKDQPHSPAEHNPHWCRGDNAGMACGDDPCWACIDWAFAELEKKAQENDR